MTLEAFLPYIYGFVLALPFLVLIRQFVYRFLSLKEQELKILTKKSNSDNSFRYQAYERMTLFLERIKPSNLVTKFNENISIDQYCFLLEKNISEEFEYNASQQLYIDNDTWQNLITTKNDILSLLSMTKEKMSKEASVQEFKTLFLMNYLSGKDFIMEMINDLRKDVSKIN